MAVHCELLTQSLWSALVSDWGSEITINWMSKELSIARWIQVICGLLFWLAMWDENKLIQDYMYMKCILRIYVNLVFLHIFSKTPEEKNCRYWRWETRNVYFPNAYNVHVIHKVFSKYVGTCIINKWVSYLCLATWFLHMTLKRLPSMGVMTYVSV